MKLSKALIEGIPEYLGQLRSKTRRRGYEYFHDGCVLELECVEPDHLYAARVRGGDDYEVGLEYLDGCWVAECTCPVMIDCKHAAAALLELQRRAAAGEEPGVSTPATAKPRRSRPTREVSQPPASPLYERLVEQLGRKLDKTETGFVASVQSLYATVANRGMTEYDLATLTRAPQTYNWQALDLWLDFPADDFYFWLHLAWEFQRRKMAIPPFMEGITDLELIRAAMEKKDRMREVAQWSAWFEDFQPGAHAAANPPLDLRLVVRDDLAALEWRTSPEAPYAAFKQNHAAQFAPRFEQGALNLTPESLPLWMAAFKPWHYESWWTFKYENATARPALNRVLRLPLAPDRVVTIDGRSLARPAEPLRLKLQAPAGADGDYELSLVTAAGEPAPHVWCALDGEPALYLTERGLYTGPPVEALNAARRKLIPAPALETPGGVRFLHASKVPLPDSLAARVQITPAVVTVTCDLKPAYPGSKTEDIVIGVTSRIPGHPNEELAGEGWMEVSGRGQKPARVPQDGIIRTPDRSAQQYFPGLLEALGAKWDYYARAWKVRLAKKMPELFAQWLKSLPPEIEVALGRELVSLRDEPLSGTVSLDVEESGMDWFDLKVVLNVSDTTLTPEELKLLLNARGGFVRLGAKGWRRLQFNFTAEEDEQLARLGLHARDFSAEPQRFHALQLADGAAKKFLPAEHVERIERRAAEIKTRVNPALPPAIRAELRPYQMEGFHFLAYLTANRFGGVLADDMGLGKTLQTLAWLAWLRQEAAGGKAALPSVVVCPKSVTDNWRSEAERFYPELRVYVWRGEESSALADVRNAADLVVINYAQLRSLSPDIANVSWLAVILDEAQCIKNPDSQSAQAARAMKAEYRLALTGTPIENRLLDLWSIFAYAMPGALSNRNQFLRRFNAQDDPLARRRLAARVRPFLLRRTKGQVARDLPDRTEEDLLCEMEGRQQTLYRAELKRARQLLLGMKSPKQLNDQRFNILTSLLRLRQICCHPGLVDENSRDAESAKMVALEELLEPLMEEGHKVLVFSQFVTMLDLLRERVKQRNWPWFYLAGDTENRGDLVREFQSAAGGAVFLISLKAGGFGLNLTAASYVVLFDPWWNPAVENQAIDRTHRIGQTSKVMAYRLVMRESIEEKIRTLQKQKAALAADVLGEERFAQSLTLDDLRFLFAD